MYNPNIKKTYSLEEELSGKSVKDIKFLTPKIFRMLALGRIDLEEDAYIFLKKSVQVPVSEKVYELALNYVWTTRAYDMMLEAFYKNGYNPYQINDLMLKKIESYRNEVAVKAKAYGIVNKYLHDIAMTKDHRYLYSLAEEIKQYANFF